MPSVAPIAPGVTGSLMKPAAPHVPGGWTSPCAPGGSSGLHAPPPLQPLAAPVVPEVQNERSPCLAASIATVAMPAAAYESAISSMSARPRVRPWRKTIIGAHLPNGATCVFAADSRADCASLAAGPLGLFDVSRHQYFSVRYKPPLRLFTASM